jgi:hypothetical protein
MPPGIILVQPSRLPPSSQIPAKSEMTVYALVSDGTHPLLCNPQRCIVNPLTLLHLRQQGGNPRKTALCGSLALAQQQPYPEKEQTTKEHTCRIQVMAAPDLLAFHMQSPIE